MTFFPEKHFHKVYWPVCILVGIIVVLRCILIPFSHDEVATFFFYIQGGDFFPFYAHPDANNHFLTSLTSWIFFKWFGSMPWALRIPCIGAYMVLAYSVFKFYKLFKGVISKTIFTSAFILSFNFIGFYSLCRGYGFSMALLMLGMYYFYVYIRYLSNTHFWKFLLFSQLALSANLTLTIIIGVTTAIVIFYQFRNNLFFKWKTILLLLVHFGLLFYWIKYAFFLKESGALYYGEGDSYWQVTFQTLIETIFGKSQVINIMLIVLFAVMFGYFLFRLFKEKTAFLFENNFALSFVTFCSLVLVFYLMKKILHVNYPEDRTGLFFYLFFMMSFCLMLIEFSSNIQMIFTFIPLFFIGQFYVGFNLRVHPWRVYETMPQSFFDLLVKEQANAKRPVTIAGHRVREFIFGFQNYNSDKKLSHMTAPEALQMNCDYALAMVQDKPYYNDLYDELARDDHWGFRLLKRKKEIERRLIFEKTDYPPFNGAFEYYNAFEKLDTSFSSEHPVQAEFTFSIKKAAVPFKAWLVIQVDGENSDGRIFVRTPLNLVKYNWDGTANFTTALVTGNVPLKIKRVVAYLWNIDKTDIDIHLHSFRLYQLNAEGITKISPAKI